jgi:hypothetical protein
MPALDTFLFMTFAVGLVQRTGKYLCSTSCIAEADGLVAVILVPM